MQRMRPSTIVKSVVADVIPMINASLIFFQAVIPAATLTSGAATLWSGG